jgi:hypothetical protein
VYRRFDGLSAKPVLAACAIESMEDVAFDLAVREGMIVVPRGNISGCLFHRVENRLDHSVALRTDIRAVPRHCLMRNALLRH